LAGHLEGTLEELDMEEPEVKEDHVQMEMGEHAA
jgi:hypothetical protein